MLYIICNFNEVFRDVYESLVRKHLTALKIDSWPVAEYDVSTRSAQRHRLCDPSNNRRLLPFALTDCGGPQFPSCPYKSLNLYFSYVRESCAFPVSNHFLWKSRVQRACALKDCRHTSSICGRGLSANGGQCFVPLFTVIWKLAYDDDKMQINPSLNS